MINNDLKKIEIVILAGGQGKRMKSKLPKVLMPVSGKPMIKYLLESIEKSGICEKPTIIVGYGKEEVIKELGDKYNYIYQEKQLGTGHAVFCAKDILKAKHIVVLSGDQPFISAETIKKLIDTHIKEEAKITLTTATIYDFEDWRKNFIRHGRILQKNGEISGMREYKDATEEERNIKKINVGAYVFKSEWLWKNLVKIKNENAQGEYYLTDLVHIAKEGGEKISSIEVDGKEALAANSKEELEILESFGV